MDCRYSNVETVSASVPALLDNLFSGILPGRQTRARKGTPIEPRVCKACGVTFTPKRRRNTRKNPGTCCSKRCASHVPRPASNFITPESTKAERVRANGLINQRIKLGHFERPKKCDFCDKAGRTDAHHPDYSKPDVVAFLCRSCHLKAHFRPEFEREVAKLAQIARKHPHRVSPHEGTR